MSLESKIESFLETEKGEMWLRVFPDYFSEPYRALASDLINKLLKDFSKHADNKKGTD